MDMSEKTVLVTGATSGIGFVAASQLAAMGARVILVGRNKRKGDSAIKNILNSTPQAILRYFSADLSCQQDIIILAKEIIRSEPKLDILINNMKTLLACDFVNCYFTSNKLKYNGLNQIDNRVALSYFRNEFQINLNQNSKGILVFFLNLVK